MGKLVSLLVVGGMSGRLEICGMMMVQFCGVVVQWWNE